MNNSNQPTNLPQILLEPGIKSLKLLTSALNFENNLPNWSFSTDSRNIEAGSWFIALKGANFDGHRFLEQALKAGVRGFILSEIPEGFSTQLPILLVEDTLEAYQVIARHHRQMLNPKTIAITGSNGKTTTKEMLLAVLSSKFCVTATYSNENNEIGVPKTILKTHTKTQVLILECGMRCLGQIKELTQIAEPDVSVITSIGTAHIGLLGSREKIAEAKSEIFRFMQKGTTAYIPFNEPLLKPWIEETGNKINFKYFGEFSRANFKEDKLHFEYKGDSFYLYSPNVALVSNACAVIDIAQELGLSRNEIQEGLSRFKPFVGRGIIKFLKTGATIIDETYNANPDSTVALAESLACLGKNKRKILVLGEMAELGDLKAELLKEMAKKLYPAIDEAILIGTENKELVLELQEKSRCFSSLEETFQFLSNKKEEYLSPDCLLGFKASRVSRLEDLINMLENLR